MELKQYIQHYFGLEPEELKQIIGLFRDEKLSRGEFFLKEKELCQKLSFVKSGQFRMFTRGPEKEVTQWIATPGHFLTDLSSLSFKQAARWNIQALSDAELYTIGREDYECIGERVKSWHHLEKLFLARCFSILEDRIQDLLALSAEERYHSFFRSQPELFNTVPQQYLASMLGMSPETFSRIRAKAVKGKH